MHRIWANDHPGIYRARHVLPAGQYPPTEGCSRAAIWVERQPNGMDPRSLSHYSEVLSWAIPEVVLKRRNVPKGAPPPGVTGQGQPWNLRLALVLKQLKLHVSAALEDRIESSTQITAARPTYEADLLRFAHEHLDLVAGRPIELQPNSVLA